MSSAYSYIHGKLPKTWIHFDTHGSSYEGFHLCLSELAFINQFYSILTRLKPGQNKKGQNIFQLHHFLNTLLLNEGIPRAY